MTPNLNHKSNCSALGQFFVSVTRKCKILNHIDHLVPSQKPQLVTIHNKDIRNPRANTNLFFNYFFPSSTRAWNDLPDDIRNSPTVSSSKFRLSRNRYTPPKYFNVGSRKGQILHAILRMECSFLISFEKNIVPSPSCTCGGFESTYNFLFKCPKYSRTRNVLLPPNLLDFTTERLLFGRDMSNTENEQLFIQVQNYIINTKRFM